MVALFVLMAAVAGAIFYYRGISTAPHPLDTRQTPQPPSGPPAKEESPSATGSVPDGSRRSPEETPRTAKATGADDSTSEKATGPASPDILAHFGTLKLESTPGGAAVSIDGETRGRTPVEIKLAAGPHEVRLILDDHGDWEARIKVLENRVTHVPVELMPLQ
jgi:hypothetical protein